MRATHAGVTVKHSYMSVTVKPVTPSQHLWSLRCLGK